MIDLKGKKFGRLTVINSAGRKQNATQLRWNCVCDCGGTATVFGQNLRRGTTLSCGCLNRSGHKNVKHGQARGGRITTACKMFYSARNRAITTGLKFSLLLEHIVIPSHCPLLGIPIHPNPKKLGDSSPSLDRIDPSLGYTKENTWVISYKANRCKGNLTLHELRRLVEALQERMQ